MSTSRVLVCLQRTGKDHTPRLASFTECVVNYFENGRDKVPVSARLENNRLIISDDTGDQNTSLFLKHPTFCPVSCMDDGICASLPEATLSRGINTGVAVILESADGKILLTKRAPHLHTFPNIWVPPGGHLEADESLTQAGLRELHEETGLLIQEQDCQGEQLQPLALWESVYPPKLLLGPPVRHHIVLYLHAKLKEPNTAEAVSHGIMFDTNEVAACAWLDRTIVSAVVRQSEETEHAVEVDPNLPHTIRAHVLDDKKNQIKSNIPLAPLLEKSGATENGERVSTGTKYALEQFLLTYK